jgi:hypothetical protein
VTLVPYARLAQLLRLAPISTTLRHLPPARPLSFPTHARMASFATSRTNSLPGCRYNLAQWVSTRSQQRLHEPVRLLNAQFVQRAIIAEHVLLTKTVARRMLSLSTLRSWHAQKAIIAQRE